MLKSYLMIAFRHLNRAKVFSVINVLGLAIGMTACLLILHYVNYEESYDKYHENSERIYRLRYERTDESGKSVRFASCCPPAAASIRGNYPEVEKIARMLKYRGSVSYEDRKFLEERVYFAEPDLFQILNFSFIKGDPTNSLGDPNNACISEATAERYFGDDDPIGKTISVDKKTDYEIVGVFENTPSNTHLKVDILLPWEKLASMFGPEYTEAWGHTGSYTYLIVREGTDPRALEEKLVKLAEAEAPWMKDYSLTMALPMQPLTDIHLNSHFMQELEANGNRDRVDILFIIAIVIMIMAWVNFVNLSTARSINRAREVGLRKVIGACRRQLMEQFFLEIVVTVILAIASTVGLVVSLLPAFGQFTGMPADYALLTRTWFWQALAGMLLAGVFLSGLYPVIAMSSFKPATVLRGKLWNSARGCNLRRVLVVLQFTVGLILVIATITVFQQISFMRSQKLGFDMEQTLIVRAPRVRDEAYGTKFEPLRESLLQRTDIDRICHVTEVPGRQLYWDAGGIRRAGEDINQSRNYLNVGIDYDFVDLFDLEFVAGRNFSREYSGERF
jgi:putative ABC transport system permease protein